MSRLSRTQSSLTVAQPSALLPRTYSVPDISERAGFNYTTRYPMHHYVNYPYRYYNGESYGTTLDFKPSLLRSFYRRSPMYYNYPYYYWRSTYRNYNFDHFYPHFNYGSAYYKTLFNYYSPYRSYFYNYYML